MKQRGWIILAMGVLASGVCITGCGFLYDVFFAGIPYQDPPPLLQAEYAFHARVAEGLTGLGCILGGCGVILAVGWGLVRWVQGKRK